MDQLYENGIHLPLDLNIFCSSNYQVGFEDNSLYRKSPNTRIFT